MEKQEFITKDHHVDVTANFSFLHKNQQIPIWLEIHGSPTSLYYFVEMGEFLPVGGGYSGYFLGEGVPLGLWYPYPTLDHYQLHFQTLF